MSNMPKTKNEKIENENLYTKIELLEFTKSNPKHVRKGIALSGLYPPFSIALINSYIPPIASNVANILQTHFGKNNIVKITIAPPISPKTILFSIITPSFIFNSPYNYRKISLFTTKFSISI